MASKLLVTIFKMSMYILNCSPFLTGIWAILKLHKFGSYSYMCTRTPAIILEDICSNYPELINQNRTFENSLTDFHWEEIYRCCPGTVQHDYVY